MNLVAFEDVDPEQIQLAQEGVRKDWESVLKDLEENKIKIENFEFLTFVTHDYCMVCDKEGNVKDMWYLLYPHEGEN